MDSFIRDLYYLTEDRFGRDYLYQPDYQAIVREFNACMDQVEAATSYEFHEDLHKIIMDYLILEQNKSFLWGLRLGLWLQTL